MQEQANAGINLIPLFVVYVILAICMTPVSKRKGKKIWLNWIMCMLPVINTLWILYVISLTDAAVEDELVDLRRAVEELKQAK